MVWLDYEVHDALRTLAHNNRTTIQGETNFILRKGLGIKLEGVK